MATLRLGTEEFAAVDEAQVSVSSDSTSQSRLQVRSRRLQVAFAASLALAMAAYFWIDSRYPALQKKEQMGKAIHIAGGLSFDALIAVKPEMPLLMRAGYTAIDWGWTNRIGMTFGVLFGASMLTLLAYVPRRRFQNAYTNTAVGALMGAPLGVCANCVAPIGRGLFEGGASAATTVAAMISSPTLNVVVVSMAFTLLPLPIALVRLAAPLLLLVMVPWLTRSLAGAANGLVGMEGAVVCPIEVRPARAVAAVGKLYVMNLGKIALATIPWMVLAGLLGAVVVEIFPAQSIPMQVTLPGLVLVALLGTFAPMPIAFDVAFAWILLSRGVPAPYVATLACTLGATSVYPFLILGRSLSWRVALSVFAAVMVVGIGAGLLIRVIG